MRLRGNRRAAATWRAAARGYRVTGRMDEYRRCARTAALIEGRPWKVDRQVGGPADGPPVPAHRHEASWWEARS
jgi:hypothetical protein